jgi:hypothetical protein
MHQPAANTKQGDESRLEACNMFFVTNHIQTWQYGLAFEFVLGLCHMCDGHLTKLYRVRHGYK